MPKGELVEWKMVPCGAWSSGGSELGTQLSTVGEGGKFKNTKNPKNNHENRRIVYSLLCARSEYPGSGAAAHHRVDTSWVMRPISPPNRLPHTTSHPRWVRIMSSTSALTISGVSISIFVFISSLTWSRMAWVSTILPDGPTGGHGIPQRKDNSSKTRTIQHGGGAHRVPQGRCGVARCWRFPGGGMGVKWSKERGEGGALGSRYDVSIGAISASIPITNGLTIGLSDCPVIPIIASIIPGRGPARNKQPKPRP